MLPLKRLSSAKLTKPREQVLQRQCLLQDLLKHVLKSCNLIFASHQHGKGLCGYGIRVRKSQIMERATERLWGILVASTIRYGRHLL